MLLSSVGLSINSCSNIVNADSFDDHIIDSSAQGITIDGNRIIISFDYEPGKLLSVQHGWLLLTDKRLLVLNTDGENVNAFSSVCPHASCAVNWTSRNGNFTCTCHGSVFNSQGDVQTGPATRNLTPYQVIIKETQIEIIT